MCASVPGALPAPSLPQIPGHIPKPDYFKDGYPKKEQESRQQQIGEWVEGVLVQAVSRRSVIVQPPGSQSCYIGMQCPHADCM
jgi:hypothetical protein